MHNHIIISTKRQNLMKKSNMEIFIKNRILDNFGWNFRHAQYHEENRRTLVKAYGLKFLVVIDGQASKFDLKNTVIVLVTGLGLLGLSTMFCDFILLNYSTDRRIVSYVSESSCSLRFSVIQLF